jgi:dTDP-4-dehydrorhamnose 3,5-epimerase
MKILTTSLPGVLIVEPTIYPDHRGHFLEAWNTARYAEAGLPSEFVQDNVSRSLKGVVRGLHYQHPGAQGKLVGVLWGEVYDVAVDIRRGSPTFGKWFGITLSAESGRQLYVPPGFAHGFVVTSDEAVFSYKCTTYYQPASEGSVRWNDPELGIAWPVSDPVLSGKDRDAPLLSAIEADRLPSFDGGRADG